MKKRKIISKIFTKKKLHKHKKRRKIIQRNKLHDTISFQNTANDEEETEISDDDDSYTFLSLDEEMLFKSSGISLKTHQYYVTKVGKINHMIHMMLFEMFKKLLLIFNKRNYGIQFLKISTIEYTQKKTEYYIDEYTFKSFYKRYKDEKSQLINPKSFKELFTNEENKKSKDCNILLMFHDDNLTGKKKDLTYFEKILKYVNDKKFEKVIVCCIPNLKEKFKKCNIKNSIKNFRKDGRLSSKKGIQYVDKEQNYPSKTSTTETRKEYSSQCSGSGRKKLLGKKFKMFLLQHNMNIVFEFIGYRTVRLLYIIRDTIDIYYKIVSTDDTDTHVICGNRSLPKIKEIDMVSKFFGLKKGQIVRKIFVSETAGRYRSFQQVI